jgi:GT2 family glycosyltransferase
MALIAMAVHDTAENGKDTYTARTLMSLLDTVDFDKHRLFVIINAATDKTLDFIDKFKQALDDLSIYKPQNPVEVITLSENIGTARAINLAWKQRNPGEPCIKIDNDIVTTYEGWVEEMEAAIAREPRIGQVGLKRKDCIETPWRTDHFRSELMMLPHEPGEPWVVVEKSAHVMGSCVMHSAALLDKVGYLWQPGLYGWDDVLMSHRANAAGFMTVFLSHIPIDHIDPGDTPYQTWKHREAGKDMEMINKLIRGYKDGSVPYYYDHE